MYPSDPVNVFDLDGNAGWHCSSQDPVKCQAELKRAQAAAKKAQRGGITVRSVRRFFKTHRFERTRCLIGLISVFRGSKITGMPAGNPGGQVQVGAKCGGVKATPPPPDPRMA